MARQQPPDHPVTDQQEGAPLTDAQQAEAERTKPTWDPATHGPLDDDRVDSYQVAAAPGEAPEVSPVTGQPVEEKAPAE